MNGFNISFTGLQKKIPDLLFSNRSTAMDIIKDDNNKIKELEKKIAAIQTQGKSVVPQQMIDELVKLIEVQRGDKLEIWFMIFNMKADSVRSRGSRKFGFSIDTDGVGVCVHHESPHLHQGSIKKLVETKNLLQDKNVVRIDLGQRDTAYIVQLNVNMMSIADFVSNPASGNIGKRTVRKRKRCKSKRVKRRKQKAKRGEKKKQRGNRVKKRMNKVVRHWRMTTSHRNHATGEKRFRKKREKEEANTTTILGQTVKQHLATLNGVSHCTMIADQLAGYIKAKNMAISILKDYYVNHENKNCTGGSNSIPRSTRGGTRTNR